MMLKGKTAIITGASSGIGRAAALLFAEKGASIIANGRRADALDDVVCKIRARGGAAYGVTGDIRQPETHARLVSAAIENFGRLDIRFNNAGVVGSAKPAAEITPDEWLDVISINLTGAFFGACAQIPTMLQTGGGAIVFTGSFVGNSVGLPGMTAYAAAKSGLMGLVRGLTADYAAMGIRANALLPGGVDTGMAGSEEQKEWAAGLHALKRIASPEEIAKAALFLVSDDASFVAGSALWADGGNAAVKL